MVIPLLSVGNGVTPYTIATLFHFDFSVPGGLWQDSAQTTPVQSDTDPIGYAADQSGNSVHVLQGTDMKRPLWAAGVRNGHGAASFVSALSTRLATSGSSTIVSPSSVPYITFIVCNMPSAAATQYLFDSKSTSQRNAGFYSGDGTIHLYAGSDRASSSLTYGTANWHLWEFEWNGASASRILQDGTQILSSTSGTQSLNGLTIGSKWDGNNPANFYIGEVFAVKQSDIGNAERGLLRGYIKAKWMTP